MKPLVRNHTPLSGPREPLEEFKPDFFGRQKMFYFAIIFFVSIILSEESFLSETGGGFPLLGFY